MGKLHTHHTHLIRSAQLADLDACYAIERAGYGGDEAATREKIQLRIEQYPEGFLVLEVDQQVIGFINCGACHEIALSDEAFKELIGHDPKGPNIVIMSVVVHPAHQHQGHASLLMKHFIKAMRHMEKESLYLICQSDLIGFYAQFGFIDLGVSNSTHGGLQWNEMSLSL